MNETDSKKENVLGCPSLKLLDGSIESQVKGSIGSKQKEKPKSRDKEAFERDIDKFNEICNSSFQFSEEFD
jgi:hypothetical protein